MGGVRGDVACPSRAGVITPKVLLSGVGVSWVRRRPDACSEGVLGGRCRVPPMLWGHLPEMGTGLLQNVGCWAPFWAMNAELHGFGTTPVLTNTQDAGKDLESYGAVEGVFVWSQHASFLGCLAQTLPRGEYREKIVLGAVWLTWSRLVLLRSFPSCF